MIYADNNKPEWVKVGNRVRHTVFGLGRIISIEDKGRSIGIQFEDRKRYFASIKVLLQSGKLMDASQENEYPVNPNMRKMFKNIFEYASVIDSSALRLLKSDLIDFVLYLSSFAEEGRNNASSIISSYFQYGFKIENNTSFDNLDFEIPGILRVFIATDIMMMDQGVLMGKR